MIRAAPTRSTATTPASVRVFGAVPDPPTRGLVGELRAGGTAVRAFYRDRRSDASRAGTIPFTEDDLVIGRGVGARHEWREWVDAGDAHVLLAGPPSPGDVARRTMMLRRSRTVHLWVDRLPPGQPVLKPLRKGYFGRWGLDGIFAVGSRNVDACLALTGRDVPVHVLPRVTDRGTGVPARPAIRPTIGYAGRLLPDKGVDLLLRALARLPASARPRLQVAGVGPEDTALRTRAVRLGIDRWVDWLGEIDDRALDEARARWWALIVPGQRVDGWWENVQAALNSGVPVIASRHVQAATDLVRAGRNGVIVRRDDPERWADAIAEVTDRSARDTFSSAAAAVGRAFAPHHAARWLLEVLEDAERTRRIDGRRLASRSFVDHAWSALVPDQHRPDGEADPLEAGASTGRRGVDH